MSDRNSVRTRRGPVERRSSIHCPAHDALIGDFYCKRMTGAHGSKVRGRGFYVGAAEKAQRAYVLQVAKGVYLLNRPGRRSAFGGKLQVAPTAGARGRAPRKIVFFRESLRTGGGATSGGTVDLWTFYSLH